MGVIKSGAPFEHPHFHEKGGAAPKAPQGKKLALDPYLRKLAPSKKMSPLLHAIKALFLKIASFFVPLKPSRFESRLLRILTVRNRHAPDLTFEEMTSFYQKWLAKDPSVPKEFSSLLTHFEAHQQRMRKVARLTKEPAVQKATLEMKKELTLLKSGDTRLFQTSSTEPLVLLTKTAQGWTIKILGNQKAMQKWGEVLPPLPVATKEKAPTALVFENIPHDLLLSEAWLKLFLGKANGFEEDPLKAIAPFQLKNMPFSQLKSETEKATTVFWRLLKHMPNNQSLTLQTTRLRAHTAQLFELYQRHRFNLKAGSPSYKLLRLALKSVSTEALKEFRKGRLSKEDLLYLRKELQVIESKLFKAKHRKGGVRFSFFPRPHLLLGVNKNKWGLSKPPSGAATRIKPVETTQKTREPAPIDKAALVQIASKVERQPHRNITSQKTREPAPIDNAALVQIASKVERQPYRNITSKEEALKILHAFAKETPLRLKEIFRFFSDQKLDLFNENGQKTASFWWSLNQKERDSVLALIKTWVNQSHFDSRSKVSLEESTGLLKMRGIAHAWLQESKDKLGNYYLHGFYGHGFKPKLPFAPSHHKELVEINEYSDLFIKWQTSLTDKANRSKNKQGRIVHEHDRKAHFFTVAHYQIEHNPRLSWQKPIGNRELAAVLYNFRSQPSSFVGPETVPPEAFQTDPDSVLGEGLEKYNDAWEKQDVEIPASPPLTLSEEDKKRVLHLLQKNHPHMELMAFIEESPHLMYHPDIRNFFNALFFPSTLLETLADFSLHKCFKTLPQQLEEQVTKTLISLESAMAEKAPDRKLIKGRFELAAYLLEIQAQLKELLLHPHSLEYLSNNKDRVLEIKFKEIQAPLQKLKEISARVPYLQEQQGYLARIALINGSKETSLSPEKVAERIPLLVEAFANNSPTYHIDPIMEEELQREWQEVIKSLKKSAPSADSVKGLLERIVSLKKLPLDDSEWGKSDGLRFRNNQYEIDLAKLEVRPLQAKQLASLLPSRFADHPALKPLLGELEEPIPVAISSYRGAPCYHFTIPKTQIKIMVVDGEKDLSVFREVEGKWLQYVPPEKLMPLTAEKLLQKTGKTQPVKAFFLFLRIGTKNIKSSFPSFLSQGIYVDPAKSNRAFILNAQGKIDYRVVLDKTGDGTYFKKVEKKNSEGKFSAYDFNTGSDFSTPVVRTLESIERAENITILSQFGQLKEVILNRYDLSFKRVGNKLVATHPSLKGYTLVANPDPKDLKGLNQAILLEHPDPKKPRKLIVPDTNSIVPDISPLKSKAHGLAHLVDFIQKLKELVKIMRGDTSDLRVEIKLLPQTKTKKIAWQAFDLRPFSEEVIVSKETPLEKTLQLVSHYLLSNDLSAAWDLFDTIKFEELKLDSPKLSKLAKFFLGSKELPPSNEELLLKFKLGLRLREMLLKNKTHSDMIRKIEQLILDVGKEALKVSPNASLPLKITSQDRVIFSQIAKAIDPEFYTKHATVFQVEEGAEIDLSKEIPENIKALKQAIKQFKISHSPRKFEKEIQSLEEKVDTFQPLPEESLAYAFPKLKEDEIYCRLFSSKEIGQFFETTSSPLPKVKWDLKEEGLESCEKFALKKVAQELEDYRKDPVSHETKVWHASKAKLSSLLHKKIAPRLAKEEATLAEIKESIEREVSRSKKTMEMMQLLAGEKPVLTFEELRGYFARNELDKIKDRLPEAMTLEKLQALMTNYFETLVKRNALESAEKLINEMLHVDPKKDRETWKIASKTLHELLMLRCYYDKHKDPRLVIFEAQQFVQFRGLDAGLHQLDLLEKLLTDPYSIVQAPTGAGKTAVLSVMRSLLKPNGSNLVIQQVLPPLYDQTYQKYVEVLGELAGQSVYPFRFNLKMRMTSTEYIQDKEGKETSVTSSIFKKIYRDMLHTIVNKGCVLTDYKSLPLLEEWFWKLGQEMAEGGEITPLQAEHYVFLRRILILLENKADVNMDEFDEPNRPIHKIQTDMGIGAQQIPEPFINASLELYEHLLDDASLKLKENVAAELPPKKRSEALVKIATHIAEEITEDENLQSHLLSYFLGKNEEALELIKDFDPALKDKIAFYKDQFSTYLPLTLAAKQGSRYARSNDGSRVVPCSNKEKHDAKHGTLIEQLNYTIQDYYQAGITLYDLKLWLNELKKKGDLAGTEAQKKNVETRLQEVFPELTLIDLPDLLDNPEELASSVAKVNQERDLIKVFLKEKLVKLKTSGSTISMDAHNNVDLSRAVSGTSATMGSPDALHPQFHVDETMTGKIRAQMTYRLLNRAYASGEVLHYDPQNPRKVIRSAGQAAPLHAVIDGAGLFEETQDGAQALLDANKNLSEVRFHQSQEKIVSLGEPSATLRKAGFYFSQSYTRGTDIPLDPKAIALLTLPEQDTLRDYFQKEGRLRLPGQKYRVAISKYREEVETVEEVIGSTIKTESRLDAQDLYKAEIQSISACLRKGVKKSLFAFEDPNEFVEHFKEESVRELFITKPQAGYANPGDYFAKHHKIRKVDQAPQEALDAHRQKCLAVADKLRVEAANNLLSWTWSEELLAQMPSHVAPVGGDELEMELQVEEEEEVEVEAELEVNLEMEAEKAQAKASAPLTSFPPRKNTTFNDHSIAEKIHPAYDKRLFVSDDFLPLSRSPRSLRKRTPFDESMYRVGTIFVESPYGEGLKLYLEDPLEAPANYFTRTYGKSFFWDLRTGKVVRSETLQDAEPILNSPEFKTLIPQVKFFDGQLNGYNDEMLESLGEWLMQNDPVKMKVHFLHEILRYRYEDRQDFPGSQLDQLFKHLIN